MYGRVGVREGRQRWRKGGYLRNGVWEENGRIGYDS